MEALRIENLRVERSKRTVLTDVDLVHTGGVLVVLGPNGAGKTTLLKSIAGLVQPAAGRISIGGRVVFDSSLGLDLPPEERRVGYVPQGAALFPHMSVYENILFGAGKRAKREAGRLARMYAEMLGIDHILWRRASELSGGEAQKVALARALASQPELLLLDEPFSNLDAPSRERLRTELRRVLRDAGVPAVLVTHSFADAWLLGDMVVLLVDGRIVASGSPSDLLRPRGRLAAEYLGFNLVPARLVGLHGGYAVVEAGGVSIKARHWVSSCTSRLFLAFKPDDVVVSERRLSGENWFKARVVDVYETRYGARILLEALGTIVTAEVGRGYLRVHAPGLGRGATLWAHIDPELANLVCG